LRRMKLDASTGSSLIVVGEPLENLRRYLDGKRSVLLMDSNVSQIYGHLVSDFDRIDVGLGEAAKSLGNVETICRRFLEIGIDRSSFVVGIGGGVTCDLAGFAASTFMRGLPFGFAPTSLLAQADASIGGKNGVNLAGYKNIIGVFNQPRFILLDFELLRTLPAREILCGAAEIIKHALIQDAELFFFLEREWPRLLSLEREVVEEAVSRSVSIKAQIVAADEMESGVRRKLNFGHTIAHALEKAAGVSHGEAVSAGMVFASRLSVARGLLSPADLDRIEMLLRNVGLPTEIPPASEPLVEAVWKDKKREGEALRFVLLMGIGEARVTGFSRDELGRSIHDLCQHC